MTQDTIPSSPAHPGHYVGIGASAGGLEAIERFITSMPAKNTLAFIIVQHLSPDYKSLMVELLAKKTKMKVHRAEEGMEVLAGTVYLIPPKKNLTIFHGKLLLKDKSQREGINLPIDIFLQSLAEDQGKKAIAVILSGTGSDGARGVRAIKEHHGMVMVQEESTAKFDGMPRAAISTGAADFILAPENMPEQILSYVAHPYISGEKLSESLLEDADSLTRLFAELRAKTKVDFTHYKTSTISRRIERRLTINQITDFDEYVRYLTNFPGEVMALYREMLIGVTRFFRDDDAMTFMQEKIVPKLFSRIKNREIRCWVAGCSTGEEAYTLAIMFKELMEQYKVSCDVKIFATDVDREAIVRGSSGIYPESIAADLPARLLSKYFYHKEDSFHITRLIREMVVFAQHNVVQDPPFTNIDLISCRNLLIYLQPILQSKALAMFNFSLTTEGILFLGNSETVGEMTDFFKPLHQKFRIFESRGRTNPLPDGLKGPGSGKAREIDSSFGARRESRKASDRETILLKTFLDLAAERYIPLSVIVDEHLDIQQIIGNTSDYFTIPSGPIVYNISKLAAKGLAIPLATGIQKVFRTGEEVVYSNIHLERHADKKIIRLSIRQLPQRKGYENLVVIFFEESSTAPSPTASPADVYDVDQEAQQRIDDLEQELQFARENLQATIEELETSNEELQATNEELLASNEELQSTNEELQSTNEELYTVNAEHQNRIIELTELTNDVDNLLTSSRIGTLIIDENQEIRRFSPEIANIFNIRDNDIGRPFSHLSHFLVDLDPVTAATRVLKSHEPLETEVQTRNDKKYLARIVPYQIGPKIYSGVVFTFVDISELNLIRENLQQSRKTEQHIRENLPVGLLIFRQDKEGTLRLADSNPEAENLTGITINDHKGAPLPDIWPQMGTKDRLDELREVVKTGTTCIVDEIDFSTNRGKSVFHVHIFRLPDRKLAVSFEDHTSRHNFQDRLKNSGKRYDKLLKSTEFPWWEWNIGNNSAHLSRALTEMTGDAENDVEDVDAYWPKVIHPEDYQRVAANRRKYVQENTKSYSSSYRLRLQGGTYVEVSEQGEISGWDEQSKACRFIGMVNPVSSST